METKKAWVDFNLIKATVTMEMILNHYGVKGLREVRDELRGPCPIHEAKEGARSFTVNPSKNAFHCFSCGSRGNVLDFVAAMEECSIKDAALKLDEWFRVTAQETGESEAQAQDRQQSSSADLATTLIEEIESQLATLKQLIAAR